MRAAPTGAISIGTPTYSNASAFGMNFIDATSLRMQVTITAVGVGYGIATPLTLSAEL
jgi:hypothetical protein